MPKRKFSSTTMKNASTYAYRKRRRRVRSTARKALNMAQQVKKMVNKTIENKQVNFVKAATFVSTTGYDAVITGDLIQPFLSQGAQDGTTTSASAARIGNSITLMRTKLKFNFDAAATSENYNKFRVIVVESTDGAQPISLSDVLFNGALPFSSMYTTKSGTNKRYKILCDKIFECNRYGKGSKQLALSLKYGKTGRVINYNGSSSAPIDYSINVLVISDSTVAPHPSFEYTLRHTYKDA